MTTSDRRTHAILTTIRVRFNPDRQLWQSSVRGAGWYDIPRIPPDVSDDFARGYVAGRIAGEPPQFIVMAAYAETWAEEAMTYGEQLHTGGRIYTPRGGGGPFSSGV